MKQFIECGKIVSTHGLKGEIKVLPWVDNPHYLLDFDVFYLDNGEKLHVKSSRIHKNMLLLFTQEIATIEAAQAYRERVISIDRQDDEEGAIFLDDFVGLEVVNADTGKNYGEITRILITGANDVFEIKDKDGTLRLIPDIPQVVLDTNFESKTMTIRPLKGLFDDEV